MSANLRKGPHGPNGDVPGSRNFCKLHLQRARALIDLGRPQAALLEVERALGSVGNSGSDGFGDSSNNSIRAEALQLHGLCLLHLDRFDEAERSLCSAIALQPAEAHGHYLLGYCYGECKRRKEAEACYREALRISPEEPVYLRALAELLIDMRKNLPSGTTNAPGTPSGDLIAEALVHARRAVELGPDRASNHITLGFVSSASGDREAARACYQQALTIDPNNALAWNNLGCVDLAQGKPMQARERFRESLRLDPEGAAAKDNLKLVQPGQRPGPIYKEYAPFERQLVLEVWDNVLFGEGARRSEASRAASHSRVSAPQTPKQFFGNYFFPKKPADDPRLHAAALIWATEFRALPMLLWRMPQLVVWLGASLGMLRLGPSGIALALGSNAATYLLRRKPLKRRFEHYRDEIARIKDEWHNLQEAWLRGDLERLQRDTEIDRLLDDFSRYSETLREKLHAEENGD